MRAGLIVSAYYTGWSIYQRNLQVWDIDPTAVTHINYSFGKINDDGTVGILDPYSDTDKRNLGHFDLQSDPKTNLFGNFHQLWLLKQKNRNLKVGMSIGGWDGSTLFSKVSQTDSSRRKFVASALNMLMDLGLDFVDLDWEFPVGGGLPENIYNPLDSGNFVLLLKEFKAQMKRLEPTYKFKLTAALSCSFTQYSHYQIAQLAQYLDAFNMMCYDFTGDFSPGADHHANLYGRDDTCESVDKTVRHFLANGARPEQLVIGVPFYARSFFGTDGLTRPFDDVGPGSTEPGLYDYRSIPPCELHWEIPTNSSFCYNERDRSLFSFDTPTSLSYKMDYIINKNLGGVMFWEYSGDYQQSYSQSLLRVINQWIPNSAKDNTPNSLCYPRSKYTNIKNNSTCPSL